MLTVAERQREWIRLLREMPQYRQAFSEFVTDEDEPCYCAVGLMSLIPDFAEGLVEASKYYVGSQKWPYSWPDNIAPYIGLSHDVLIRVTILNDDKGWSFKQIADWIEKQHLNGG